MPLPAEWSTIEWAAPGVVVTYVCRDADGEALYVGTTCEIRRRMLRHSLSTHSARWWTLVATVTWEETTEDDRWEHERRTIEALRPRYNIDHNRDGISSSEVLALLPDLTYRQLDHWVRTGHVRASVEVGVGSGNRHRFSAQDLVGIRAVHQAMTDSLDLVEACRTGEVFARATGSPLPQPAEAAA